jgi:hypothetical protein
MKKLFFFVILASTLPLDAGIRPRPGSESVQQLFSGSDTVIVGEVRQVSFANDQP